MNLTGHPNLLNSLVPQAETKVVGFKSETA